MRPTRFIGRAGISMALGALLGLGSPRTAPAQDLGNRRGVAAPNVSGQAPTVGEDIKAIDEDYDRQVLGLERRRLELLARLAARQNPAEAAATYERLFRLAAAANLFGDAEAAAKAVLDAGSPSPVALGLAHSVKIIAEVDRGDYDQSLESLRKAVADGPGPAQTGLTRLNLPTDEVVEICDTYYQRLIQKARYEDAKKALRVLLENTQRPALKEFLSGRLRRLDVVGKPAPPIRGTDLEGKPFDLATLGGKKAVLIVFWASWCLPCEAEVDSLHEIDRAFRGKELQIVGINLDAVSDGDRKSSAVLPNVRRFLLDYNVTWPTLMNGPGDRDYAGAYGVTEIPANVLVGRDGTVLHIDLVRKNLEPTIARAIGP
jgi:thiol-disulfide isomerase/thioredoxin